MVKSRKGKGRAGPAPTPMRNPIRVITLFCWILDRSKNPFPVDIEDSRTVGHLKDAIVKKMSITLGDVELALWGVSIAIDRDLKNGVSKCQFPAEDMLLETDPLSDLFPQPGPAQRTLHIVVQLRPAHQPLYKRRRMASPGVSEEHEQFWRSLWVDQVNPIQEVGVRRGSDRVDDVDVPTTMKVLHGLLKIFSPFDVLIREEYDKALSIIDQYHATDRGVIIIGHLGIGKTMLLYYILARRLLNRQPTIFQYRSDVIHLFDAQGVSLLSPHDDVVSSAREDTWALVDSNESVSTPAPTLVRAASPHFLIVASFPCPSRWRNVLHYRPPAAFWFMQPFTLVELIQARQLQMVEHKESDIQDFFETYGPSARDCFAFCSNIKFYHPLVGFNLAGIRWDKLTTALTSGPHSLNLDDGSHKVILVEPQPEDAASPRVRIITKAVNQLLWEQDSNERWRNHRQLYRTLRRAKCYTGMLFEPPFHALCVKGATFTLYPMTKRPDGPGNHIFVNCPQTGQESFVLLPQTRVVFNVSLHTTPSFMTQLSVQMTIFQVTDEENHGLKPKGLYALRELAQKLLQVNGLTLRFVVVVPDTVQVTCLVEKEMCKDLGLEMYYLEVTEGELYGN